MLTREEILLERVKPSLPFNVFPERGVLTQLRENFKDETIGLKTEFEVIEIQYFNDDGGLIYELVPKGVKKEELETVFLCSMTHFRVKRGEENYKLLEKYRTKRIRRLSRERKKGGGNRYF